MKQTIIVFFLVSALNKKDLEDEFHFILMCPFYTDLRNKYIKSFYYKTLSVFKLGKQYKGTQ